MSYRYNQFDMPHTFTTHFLFSDFYTATIADNTFIAYSLVLTAVALIILDRTKYLFTEQAITFIPQGSLQRPDRVMIRGQHAIIIDYKFGHAQRPSHLEQVRDYMSLLSHMGYTTEGHIIYATLQTIHSIQ